MENMDSDTDSAGNASFIDILKKYGSYSDDELPPFTYQSADDADLRRVREYFRLDSIIG